MPKLIYIILLFMIMILHHLSPAFAVVDEPEDLLPGNNRVGLWSKDDAGLYFYDYSLDRILGDGIAAIVEEYGFVSMFSQFYYDDMNYIEFRIFEMESAEQAFGLFSIFPDLPRDIEEGEIVFEDFEPDLGPASTPEMHWINETEMLLLGDNFMLHVIAEDEGYKMDMLSFAVKIQAEFDVLGGRLDCSDSLERDDRIHGSDKLIPGYDSLSLYMRIGNFDPFLLGEEDVRAIMADYRFKAGMSFSQLVIEYPDEGLAKDGYAAFKNWIDSFYFMRRQNIIDGLNSYYAMDENEYYMGGFRDGRYLRVFFGFEHMDDLRDIISEYQ